MDATQLLHMWLSSSGCALHTHMEMFNCVIKATHMWGMEKCSVFHTTDGIICSWRQISPLTASPTSAIHYARPLSDSLSICVSVILWSYLCALSSWHEQQMKSVSACVLFFLSFQVFLSLMYRLQSSNCLFPFIFVFLFMSLSSFVPSLDEHYVGGWCFFLSVEEQIWISEAAHTHTNFQFSFPYEC